ncbi:MAG: glycosyltransferase family 2 protein [Actinomycetia bacterium]|nr:glycosyltransferase family 2 protein [Actinomycetes bacterium]MCP4222695.1 glycosyltransferase family 2 protein [Actinomycetes bacterium]MCP5031760.1 glycosyltransferase family 2 protein [Actinomycetes bacterium]
MSSEDQSVSVVVATRDRPELLRRALDGIMSQELDAHLEVIVVFDRSEPDHSLECNEARRRIIVTTNGRAPGLAGARNSGIDKASNHWLAFCDDDDEWLPGKLAAQLAALRADPLAQAACTGILIRYKGKDTPRIPDPLKLTFGGFLDDRMTEVHPSSWLVNRELLTEQIGLVDEELPGSYAEDYDLLLRTSRLTTIAVAPEPLVRVWWHGASFFFERWKMIDDALGYLIAKYPEFNEHPVGLARIEGQRALAQAAMGDRGRAFGTARRCLSLNRFEKRVPLAALVAAGVPAGFILSLAHRFGRGL